MGHRFATHAEVQRTAQYEQYPLAVEAYEKAFWSIHSVARRTREFLEPLLDSGIASRAPTDDNTNWTELVAGENEAFRHLEEVYKTLTELQRRTVGEPKRIRSALLFAPATAGSVQESIGDKTSPEDLALALAAVAQMLALPKVEEQGEVIEVRQLPQ